MENTINEYLNYIKSNNLQNDLSNYFTSYVSENHPNSYQEFVTPIEEPKNLKITELSKINNPIVAKPKQFNISAITQPVQNNVVSDVTISDGNNSNIGKKFKNREEFISAIKPGVLKVAKELGIDPNIIIGQAIAEQGDGNSSTIRNANNIFNITGYGGWKGDVYVGRDYNQKGELKEGVKFRKYATFEDSIRDWGELMKRQYGKSLAAAKISPEEFFKVHSWSGYAEGVGKTKQEAKNKLYNLYKSTYKKYV